jgi:transposase
MKGTPMRGPKATPIHLSEVERQGLEKLVSKHSTAQQVALRGRIILAAANEKPNVHIAREFGITLDMVRLWRKRWQELQPISLNDLSIEERLQDLPRPGAPAKITADQLSQIIALACEKPEASERPITHWSSREIADEIIQRGIVEKISPRHAARLLKRG